MSRFGPLARLTARGRAALAVVVLLLFAVSMIWLLMPPVETPGFQGSDANSYFAIAAGHPEYAYYYYGGRILHPLSARLVAHLTGTSLSDGFRLLSCLSLAVLFAALGLLAGDPALLPFLVLPGLIAAFRTYYFPELFHAALTAVFFLIFNASWWLALPILLLLHITRESTVLLTASLALVTIGRDRRFAIAAIGVGIAGILVTSVLVTRGVPSHHGLPGPLFDLFKLIYNFAGNVLGLVFWTNTNALTTNCLPRWKVMVHLGSIRQIGLCGFYWREPIITAVALASSFGVMPMLFIPRGRGKAAESQPTTQVARLYGALSLCAAPLIGTAVARYTFYAWPLFWIGGADSLGTLKVREYFTFALLTLAAAWVPVATYKPVAGLIAEAVIYYLAFRTIAQPAAQPPVASQQARG